MTSQEFLDSLTDEQYIQLLEEITALEDGEFITDFGIWNHELPSGLSILLKISELISQELLSLKLFYKVDIIEFTINRTIYGHLRKRYIKQAIENAK